MYIWLMAAVTAYFVKGLSGFANTLVFTTILSFAVPNVNISPIDLVLGYPANMLLTWKNRKSLKKEIYVPLSLLVLAGSIPGSLLLKNADVRLIKLVFGIVVVGLGGEMLWREHSQKRIRPSKLFLVVIGVSGGMLCGLFGVGALLAAYVSRVTKDSREFRANISLVFLVNNIFRMFLYGTLGLFTLETVKTALALFPAALVGLFAGIQCASRLNEAAARKIISILLILLGISLMIKSM